MLHNLLVHLNGLIVTTFDWIRFYDYLFMDVCRLVYISSFLLGGVSLPQWNIRAFTIVLLKESGFKESILLTVIKLYKQKNLNTKIFHL